MRREKPAKVDEPKVTRALLAELRHVLIWLGCHGNDEADESGDWRDYEDGGLDLGDLAYSYWEDLSHQVMLAELLLRLPQSIHDDPRVLALLRDGFPQYEKAFLDPPGRVQLRKLPSVTVGKTKYVLETTYDEATAERARALITGKRRRAKPAKR